ncbi:hypothetical protein [Paenibacillus oryzisoli]|uniref:hypothetical protein n=1 Tax=Paenibacillus oryzisoli TaxID=1850517 RepID=UPI0012F9CD10|nr:hypothetical protein [Paenibacillus oryzisoli]
MNFKQATDAQLIQIIYHEKAVPLSLIQGAAEEYERRHGSNAKWWRREGSQRKS